MIKKIADVFLFFLVLLFMLFTIEFVLSELFPPRQMSKAGVEQSDILIGRPSRGD